MSEDGTVILTRPDGARLEIGPEVWTAEDIAAAVAERMRLFTGAFMSGMTEELDQLRALVDEGIDAKDMPAEWAKKARRIRGRTGATSAR